MKRKKLSRREAQLVSQAERRAVEEYKQHMTLTIRTGGENGPVQTRVNLVTLQYLNTLAGLPHLTISYVWEDW